MIGAVLGHGQQIRLRSLSRQERSDAVDQGFSCYREGQGGVMEAFDKIQARSSARAVQAGPLAVYGRLYDWLDGGAKLIDPGPIRPLLREHILSHTSMTKGAEPGLLTFPVGEVEGLQEDVAHAIPIRAWPVISAQASVRSRCSMGQG